MNRYHLQNDTHMIEFPATTWGKMQALAFRRTHKEFERRRLREVLQLMPNEAPCGVVIELTNRA